MNRRAFFSRLLLVAGAASLAGAPRASDAQPYTETALYCPQCGECMMIVDRRHELRAHDSPRTWTCHRCERSWSTPYVRVAATPVAFNDGYHYARNTLITPEVILGELD
jgi:hypothetical protein